MSLFAPIRARYARTIALFFLGCLSTLFAQNTLQVDVRDPSGAAVEAVGRVESPGGVRVQFTTNAQGTASVSGLETGRYRLTVTKRGFADYSSLVDVDAATVSKTVTLQLGTAGFAVDVVDGTILPGVELERNEVPAPVQSASAGDIDRSFISRT
jgi:hypothetical protein